MSEQYPEYVEGRLFALFRKEFELCNVRPGERVAVMYDAATRPDYVTVSAGALESLGAIAFTIGIPGIERGDLTPPPEYGLTTATEEMDLAVLGSAQGIKTPAAELMAAVAPTVDMVVDLLRLHHGVAVNEILHGGARILSIGERPDALERLFSAPDLKQRVLVGVDLLDRAQEMRVTSSAGTDLIADISGCPGRGQYGYADRPGRQAAWPGGYVATFPRPMGTNGTIVLDVGDMIFHFQKYVETPVRIMVVNSHITKIEGDGLDAKLIRDYLGRWNDPESFATSHLGWGLNEGAQWHALQFYDKNTTQGQDGRGLYGGFMWSTGPNPYAKRYVPGHLDIPMLGCNISLDGQPVVINGDIVHEGMKPLARRRESLPVA